MVIWITGLSAAGKTTLSKEIERQYRKTLPNLVLLDGDAIRLLYGNDLTFVESDRVKQIKRIQSLTSFLEKQSLVVIVAALYANDELLAENRELFDEYFEVYLKADLPLLRSRETKGLYLGASENSIKHVVGVDIPWYEPKNPDLLIDMAVRCAPEELAQLVYRSAFTAKAA